LLCGTFRVILRRGRRSSGSHSGSHSLLLLLHQKKLFLLLLEQILLILLLLLSEKLLLRGEQALFFLFFAFFFLANKGFEVQKYIMFVFCQSFERFFQFFHVLNCRCMFFLQLFANIFRTEKKQKVKKILFFFCLFFTLLQDLIVVRQNSPLPTHVVFSTQLST
jgi:hypothetical protein